MKNIFIPFTENDNLKTVSKRGNKLSRPKKISKPKKIVSPKRFRL